MEKIMVPIPQKSAEPRPFIRFDSGFKVSWDSGLRMWHIRFRGKACRYSAGWGPVLHGVGCRA